MGDLERLIQRLERERRARKAAEQLLEEKSAELYEAQQTIRRHAEMLEATVRERTAQLQDALARAEEGDRLKSQFVANVSHELRTPLNIILGYTDILIENEVYDREPLERVRDNAVLLNSLVADVLDFSRLRAQKLRMHSESVDVTALVGEIDRNVAVLCRRRGLHFESRVDPGRIVTDPSRLKQILLNLIGNAIKFTTSGSVSVTAEHGDGVWRIGVRDTGRGIAPEDQELIFTPFQQAGGDGHDAGTGLGLAIVRELVALLGGEITLASTLGCGSTFTVSLPEAVSAESQQITPLD